MKNPVPKRLTNQIHIPVTCLLLLFQFLIPNLANGQCFRGWSTDTSAPRTRNIIFTTPVAKNSTINGLALGFQPNTWHEAQILNINGVSISASPIDPFIALLYLCTTLPDKFGDDDFNSRRHYPYIDTSKETYNGLIVGSFSPRVKCNGVNIAAVMNYAKTMKGLSIAGLFNHHYSFKGVLIAGIRNKTTKGKGLQIGLLNRCQEGKLVQIGLLNRIGKRTIPFINFQF
jgi:hypothetical protein